MQNGILRFGPVLAGAGVILTLTACGGDRAPEGIQIRTEVRGDTTVVTSRGAPPVQRAGQVEILLRGAVLEAPRSVMRVGDQLVLADRRRIHLVNAETGVVRSAGATGEGPGEFGTVGSLGFAGPDRVAVHDPRRQRVLLFDIDGAFVEEPRAPLSPPLVNPVAGPDPEHFLLSGGDAFWVRTGNVSLGIPLPAGLLRQTLGADRVEELERWDDRTFEALPSGLLGSRELFPPTTRHAFSRDGRMALGLGNTPCLTVRQVGPAAVSNGGSGHPFDAPDLLRICRDRPPVPAGPSLRSGDLSALEAASERDQMEADLRTMERPERLPYYDRLLFAENGDLWVRTPGEELADAHPWLLGRVPELRPEIQRWEVFSPAGALRGVVEMPYTFRPWVVEADRVYGIAELETGELALGAVRLRPLAADGGA